jgi:hypothetical protein
VADVLNTTWQPEKPVTWGQAAFYVMTAIMALFIMVKNFLWAKYAHGDELTAYLANQQAVTVPEHAIGSPATVAESIADGDDESEPQPTKVPFGFAANKAPAASSADRNRAANMHVNTGTCNTHACNTHEHVNTRACNTHEHVNNMHVGNKQSSGKSTNYDSAASAKVGSMIDCPQCGTTFRKANKWHTFCCPSCRDNWHNEQNPERIAALKAIKRRKSA